MEGEIPYADMNNNQVMEQVPNGYRLAVPSNAPIPISKLMMKCWEKGYL